MHRIAAALTLVALGALASPAAASDVFPTYVQNMTAAQITFHASTSGTCTVGTFKLAANDSSFLCDVLLNCGIVCGITNQIVDITVGKLEASANITDPEFGEPYLDDQSTECPACTLVKTADSTYTVTIPYPGGFVGP